MDRGLEQAFRTGTLNNIFQRKRVPEKWVCNQGPYSQRFLFLQLCLFLEFFLELSFFLEKF